MPPPPSLSTMRWWKMVFPVILDLPHPVRLAAGCAPGPARKIMVTFNAPRPELPCATRCNYWMSSSPCTTGFSSLEDFVLGGESSFQIRRPVDHCRHRRQRRPLDGHNCEELPPVRSHNV